MDASEEELVKIVVVSSATDEEVMKTRGMPFMRRSMSAMAEHLLYGRALLGVKAEGYDPKHRKYEGAMQKYDGVMRRFWST
jgi:hypothetical protein